MSLANGWITKMYTMFRVSKLPRRKEDLIRNFGRPNAPTNFPPRLRTSRLFRYFFRADLAATWTPATVLGTKPIVAAEYIIIIPPGITTNGATTSPGIDLSTLAPGSKVHIYNYGTINGGAASGKVAQGSGITAGPNGTRTYVYNYGTIAGSNSISNFRNVSLRLTGTLTGATLA